EDAVDASEQVQRFVDDRDAQFADAGEQAEIATHLGRALALDAASDLAPRRLMHEACQHPPHPSGRAGHGKSHLVHGAERLTSGRRGGKGCSARRASVAMAVGSGSIDGHSIDGSTRSGGLWPSTNVLMLMITFSPMSLRPSMVADPMCGRITARLHFTSLGLTAGSCSNTSSPAPASSPASSIRASAFSSITSPRAVLTI